MAALGVAGFVGSRMSRAERGVSLASCLLSLVGVEAPLRRLNDSARDAVKSGVAMLAGVRSKESFAFRVGCKCCGVDEANAFSGEMDLARSGDAAVVS